MNTHSTTPQAATVDPAIAASHRFALAVAHHAAALNLTGNLMPGPDFDAAEAIQNRTKGELEKALVAFTKANPQTPIAFATYLDAFAKALEREHADKVSVFREPDDEDDGSPTACDVTRVLVVAFERIFEGDGGEVHAAPQLTDK